MLIRFLFVSFRIKQIGCPAVVCAPAVITLPSVFFLFFNEKPALHPLIKPIAPKTNSPVLASHLDEMRGPTQWRKFTMRLHIAKQPQRKFYLRPDPGRTATEVKPDVPP